MFASDFIDGFSRIPWYVVPLIYVPALLGFLTLGLVRYEVPLPAAALLFGVGWVVWTLTEYWLHRTLFHWTPRAPWGERFHFILHGVHHEWYRDRLRLVMPPAVSVGIGALIWGGLRLIAWATSGWVDPSWTFPWFAGFLAGYLCYDMVHYYIHHGRPRSAMMQALRAHHAKHHHNPEYADRKFGVSTTVWDHVFGTY